MQFDFKEKAKKRQDRNSPIKPLFCIQFENPSKVSWGEFQISMGFVQPPRSAPIFASPHESLVTPFSISGISFYRLRRAQRTTETAHPGIRKISFCKARQTPETNGIVRKNYMMGKTGMIGRKK